MLYRHLNYILLTSDNQLNLDGREVGNFNMSHGLVPRLLLGRSLGTRHMSHKK